MGRTRVPAYASSINWLDDATVEAEIAAALKAGFREIKVKTGHAGQGRDRACKAGAPRSPATMSRSMSMPTGSMTSTRPCSVGRALADLGYGFFEEPIAPHDRAGYAKLARHLPIRLAAGESDYVASDALNLLHGSLDRADPAGRGPLGRMTETWRIAELAASFHTAYAPHVGWSGAHLRRRKPATRRRGRDHAHLRMHGL